MGLVQVKPHDRRRCCNIEARVIHKPLDYRVLVHVCKTGFRFHPNRVDLHQAQISCAVAIDPHQINLPASTGWIDGRFPGGGW